MTLALLYIAQHVSDDARSNMHKIDLDCLYLVPVIIPHLFYGQIMYVLRIISNILSPLSHLIFHAVAVKSSSHTHTGILVLPLSYVISIVFPYCMF